MKLTCLDTLKDLADDTLGEKLHNQPCVVFLNYSVGTSCQDLPRQTNHSLLTMTRTIFQAQIYQTWTTGRPTVCLQVVQVVGPYTVSQIPNTP